MVDGTAATWRRGMARKHHPDPEVYDYRMPVGCMMLFGLPFLLGGLFAIVLSLSPDAGRRDVPDWYILLPGGLLLFGVGVLLVFTRRGTEIDHRNGRVTKWWGLLWPMARTVHPLADFDQVAMSQRVERGRRRSYTVYPVTLVGPKVRAVEVDTKLTFSGADELAKDIARCTGFQFVDRSQGSPIVRLAAEVDASLRERQQGSGARVNVPDPPADARSRVAVFGETIRFDIPAPGFHRRDLWGMGFGLLVPAGVALLWLKPVYQRGAVPLPMMAALAVLLVGLPFVVFFVPPLSVAWRRTRVEASPRELRVRFRGMILRRTRALLTHTVKEIEVVDLASFKGNADARGSMGELVVVRSDHGTLAFGVGLSDAELDWIRAVLWNVVTA
jgi:hypothetical protein